MAQLVNMPQFGSTMEEGLVVLWKRREGDKIIRGEPLLEVETDKTIVEVEAPCDGVLRKILAPTDSRVPIHHPLAILGAENEDISIVLAGMDADRMENNEAAAVCSDTAAGHESSPEPPGDVAVVISPRARRLADAEALSVALLAGRGTGPGGRVIERDVIAYLEERREPKKTPIDPFSPHLAASTQPADPETSPGPTPVGGEAEEDLSELALGLPGSRVHRDAVLAPSSVSSMRGDQAVTSRRDIESNDIRPSHAQMTLEVSITACLALRDQLLHEVAQRYGGVLDSIHIVLKAVGCALERVPLSNGERSGEGSEAREEVNIALSTVFDDRLATQYVAAVNRKSLGRISADLSRHANFVDRQSKADALRHTFTIIALTDEVDHFHPTIPSDGMAALGLGRIAERPIAVGGQVVVRSTLNLCLTYDPDKIDAAAAALFLRYLRELLEMPVRILV
jgi:pyruvate dehydrogenase E2 component (dihydrolipoamide acetyltransferase)